MDFEVIEALLSSSATVKLLRANNASVILSFLHKEFKEANRLVVPNHELVHKLSDYLSNTNYKEAEENGEDDVQEDNLQRAARYLDQWTNQNFLRKFPDETGEHMHELGTDVEKALQWIEGLEKKEFVGTESRFKDIFKKLKDIVENTNSDPVAKIKELEKKKKQIEEEIRQIKISQAVVTFNETQIKERFYEVNKISRELLSDFKEVEQNFKDIIRNIYERQSDKAYSKGKIVGYALDAIEELKQKDQGKSFYAFWQFLIADKSQEELKHLVDGVYNLLEEKGIDYENDRFLKKIKTSLYAAGKKVIDSNRQLSAKLSKILSERDMTERRKAIELIAEIRNNALKVLKNPPKDDAFITIDGYTELNLVMSRPLGEEPQETQVKDHPTDMVGVDISHINFETLFNRFSINKTQLQQNITDLLKERNQVSLAEVIEKHPVEKGLAELLTYLSIASQSNKHIISDTDFHKLKMDKMAKKTIKLPQVIYTK